MKLEWIGLRFERLVVLREGQPRVSKDGYKITTVIVRCDCGVEKQVTWGNFNSGKTLSCGCLAREKLAAANAARSVPQKWVVEGAVARATVQGVEVVIDAEDAHLVRSYQWRLSSEGYIVAKKGRISLARLVMNLKPGDGMEADHRHHKLADNRKSELRVVTHQQNCINRRARKGLSRIKGVSRMKSGKYIARIQIELGRFETEREAAEAYNEAAKRYFGDHAYLNPVG